MSDPYGLTAENFLRMLPEPLKQNQSMYALAVVTADVLAARPAEMRKLLIYPNIDQLPEALLDILAYDFKVDWYDYNATVAVKRSTIKASFEVHRITGTKRGLEEALTSVCATSSVQEWFEYGGEPGYFKVTVHDASEFYLNSDAFLAAINRAKRLSAHLDRVTAEAEVATTVRVGFASKVRYVYTQRMEEVSVDDIECLVDEDGNMLTDEDGNLLTE